MKATEELLQSEAENVLHRVTGGVRRNTCDTISGELASILESEFGMTAYLVEAPFKGRNHYVTLIPGSEVNFTSADFVIVDSTVKQFEDQVEMELPGVAVIPSDDERIENWYSQINLPPEFTR